MGKVCGYTSFVEKDWDCLYLSKWYVSHGSETSASSLSKGHHKTMENVEVHIFWELRSATINSPPFSAEKIWSLSYALQFPIYKFNFS